MKVRGYIELERINRLEAEGEKQLAKESLMDMWRECFGDSEAYENFYFANVYKTNTVYTIENKGMLHLNPYWCMVQNEERVIHYVVGVGTNSNERRKGIMRKLLNRALWDMYKHKEPFTYLMPADVRYYAPFCFVSISSKKEKFLNTGQSDMETLKASEWEPAALSERNHRVEYLEYRQLLQMFDEHDRLQLFDRITYILKQSHDVFMKHDELYFELLAKEKGCQHGNVVFIFEGEPCEENMSGFFAYSMDDTRIYVEQYVLTSGSGITGRDIFTYVGSYFEQKTHLPLEDISIMEHFPYMVRIVDLKECLNQFRDSFYAFALEGKRLLVTDPVLMANNGIYTFSLVNGQVQVEKQRVKENTDINELNWDDKMTIEEIARWLFCGKLEDRIFFAEVV